MNANMSLIRIALLQHGAFGVMLWQGIPFAVTLERTYPGVRDGMYVPKIAAGTYTCTRTRFIHGGYDCWQIVGGDVTPDRRILIHKANVEDDLDGCVGVGEQYGLLGGKQAILQSGQAFSELMILTAEVDEFALSVRCA